MKKPSERIEEIAQKFINENDTADRAAILAIIQYLDEQYEKGQESEQFNRDFAVHDATSKLQ